MELLLTSKQNKDIAELRIKTHLKQNIVVSFLENSNDQMATGLLKNFFVEKQSGIETSK